MVVDMEVGGLGSVVLVSICSDRIRLRAIADNAFCLSFNGVASIARESPTVFITKGGLKRRRF